MTDSKICQKNSREYWQGINADIEGMLGGFAHISDIDLKGSKRFLDSMNVGENHNMLTRAVDCGAGNPQFAFLLNIALNPAHRHFGLLVNSQLTVGICLCSIGRITKGLLLGLAKTVDIVEPIVKFSNVLKGTKGVGEIYSVGLEDWSPTTKYDLVWNQWCLGHLTDTQLLVHLKKCAEILTPGGFIVVKENLSTTQEDVFDDLDSSVTRTEEKFLELFERSGLELRKMQTQKGFPKGLYPVKTFALASNKIC
ncbi:Alpha N-terminal protein methyltransferase 1 [Golovinomyces cichoracearum]|uniref:Alpha N-terminal protein methyltransferase 1 n=1 Tax=Golovinomyces cichoracearum TaxID=62708 RepID=A0A420J487_9PEZI|nr:Alpha N-terminal protein methyltransferase 1 [Golovinomyces cichoracearum]